jgi:hypothetical protein
MTLCLEIERAPGLGSNPPRVNITNTKRKNAENKETEPCDAYIMDEISLAGWRSGQKIMGFVFGFDTQIRVSNVNRA